MDIVLLSSAPVSRSVDCHHNFREIWAVYNRSDTELQLMWIEMTFV